MSRGILPPAWPLYEIGSVFSIRTCSQWGHLLMRYDSTRIVLLAHLMLVARTLLACGPSVMKRPPAAISAHQLTIPYRKSRRGLAVSDSGTKLPIVGIQTQAHEHLLI